MNARRIKMPKAATADDCTVLEDLPNKVRDALGVMVDVNRYERDGLCWLEIRVEAYPNPISYRGGVFLPQWQYQSDAEGSRAGSFSAAQIRSYLGQRALSWCWGTRTNY